LSELKATTIRSFVMTTSTGNGARLPQWRRLAIGITAAVALSACGSGSSDSGGEAGTKSITFWLSASEAQAAGYYDLAKDFQTKEGVAVEIVNVPYDAFKSKLKAAAQANALPDVGSTPWVDPLWANQLQDLTEIANSPTNKVNKNLIVPTKDGKVNYIPSDVTAAGLYINKSLFDKAGVTYPTDPAKTWTWDEFLAATEEVRTKTKAKYDLVYDNSPARIRAFIYNHGGKGFQVGSDAKVLPVDDTTVQALTKFAKMNDDKTMPKSVWTSGADPNALFKSGQVVAYFSGVWQVADFADSITSFEWASAPTPAQPVHATDINLGGHMVAFNNGDKAAASKKFVDFMFQPANYSKLAQTNGYLPVETGLTLTYPFKEKAALAAFDLYIKEMELADPISASASRTNEQLATEGKVVVEDPTKVEMAKLINGEQDVQKTVANIVAGLNQQLG
jgi:alpha-1,4-digalacturonate transport system substrate-binding protein